MQLKTSKRNKMKNGTYLGETVSKENRVKGKSKFIGLRQDVQNKFVDSLTPNSRLIKEDRDLIISNKLRRTSLKININQHPESYYNDCFVNTGLPLNRHDRRVLGK